MEIDLVQVKRDRDDYALAVMQGDVVKAQVIITKYSLENHYEELIPIGLNALARGEDPNLAITEHIFRTKGSI